MQAKPLLFAPSISLRGRRGSEGYLSEPRRLPSKNDALKSSGFATARRGVPLSSRANSNEIVMPPKTPFRPSKYVAGAVFWKSALLAALVFESAPSWRLRSSFGRPGVRLRPPRGGPGTLFGHLGRPFGHPGGPLGFLGGARGVHGEVWGLSLGGFGSQLGTLGGLGASWGEPSASSGRSGASIWAPLGSLWAAWGSLWASWGEPAASKGLQMRILFSSVVLLPRM